MKTLLKKIMVSFSVVIIISIIVFFAFQVLPGDPINVILGTEATPERVAKLTEDMGLDKPLFERYISQVIGMFSGDFGNSVKFQEPIANILAERLPVTMSLGVISMVIIIIITIPTGVLVGANYNSWFGRIVLGICNVFTAIPQYFLGVIITIVFGLVFKVFQSGNFVSFHSDPLGYFSYLFFPALAIALPNAALLIKFLSSSVNEQSNASYARTARSKGASEVSVLFHHLLKNSLLSTLTMFGMVVADIFCGSIVVEMIFNIPGIGLLLISSISARDFPLLQVITIFIATVVVIVHLIIDIVLTIVDPRIKIS